MGRGGGQSNHIFSPGIVIVRTGLLQAEPASVAHVPLIIPIAAGAHVGHIDGDIRIHLVGGTGDEFHMGLGIYFHRIGVLVQAAMF